jgi:5'-methylthioadenosine phosphorylase
MDSVKIGVIGGSGLYNMPGLTEIEEHNMSTPFGPPSGVIRVGTLAGQRVAFIARHGAGHVLTPTEVPYRANIYALKTLGVQQVISISAVGSLRDEFAPGHVVVLDQLVDFTRDGRPSSFFGDGLVGHISVADPFCAELGAIVAEAVEAAGGTVHRGGTAITVSGPRFSTRAESALFRRWGFDVIGMTTAPEAFLAREAEMCYATMAHVTDYDVWHESEETVTVDMVLQTLNANITLAQNAVIGAVGLLGTGIEDCDCYHALEAALITARDRIPAETVVRLRPLVGKYLE